MAMTEAQPTPDEAETRRKAARRSWICPGAGFAMVGNRPLGVATFIASISLAPIAVVVAVRPTSTFLVMLAASLGVGSVLWVAEQIATRKAALRHPGPAFLVRGYFVSSCAVWLATIPTAIFFAMSFDTLRMAGSGMQPTLESGEQLIYHKRIEWNDVKPGKTIVYKNAADSAWGETGWIVIARILAGPGDRLAIQDGHYVVNGAAGPAVAPTGEYQPALDIPTLPETAVVPDECYFIVQDSPAGGFDSRVLSWARRDDIMASEIWHFGRRGVFKPIE